MLSTDNSGSSKSSFPNSFWVDYGIDWKGTSRTAGPLDPPAPLSPVPPALEAISVAAGVCSGTSGFGLFDILVVSASGNPADGLSINPIASDSGADRLVPSELLDIQLRKSWIWSFSCAGRYWILGQARFTIKKLRQTGWNQRISDSYWPASRQGIFLCNKALGVSFRFLLSSEAASTEVGGIQYHVL